MNSSNLNGSPGAENDMIFSGELKEGKVIPATLKVGDAVDFHFPNGDILPGICVAAWDDEYGNFQVFLDGTNSSETIKSVCSDEEARRKACERGMLWLTSFYHRDSEYAGAVYWTYCIESLDEDIEESDGE